MENQNAKKDTRKSVFAHLHLYCTNIIVTCKSHTNINSAHALVKANGILCYIGETQYICFGERVARAHDQSGQHPQELSQQKHPKYGFKGGPLGPPGR